MMNCLTNLLPHQIPAVEKLLPVRVGALFMEMGTGKTRTAIELIVRRQGRFDRVLWFCPVSLRETVWRELHKHTDLTRDDVYIFNDSTRVQNIPTNRLVYIIGIETMSASNRAVVAANKLITEHSFVIVDESSYIKGPRAIRTRRITVMSERAKYRLVLTGTPLSQGVVDLYAQMRFLSPKILGYHSFYSFAREHLEYSDRIPGKIVRALNTDYLAQKIKPYVYQVTKEECLDLPRKLYEEYWTCMTDEQVNAYAMAKDRFAEAVSGETNLALISHYIFRLFTELQEIACGFARWRGKNGEMRQHELKNNRLALLMETIEQIPDGERVIIWSKFLYNITQIVNALADTYGSEQVATIHGGLNPHEREAEIKRFRDGARFLVASPGVGGHGLTLNEAHYVIFYSNGFKYSERLQAEDRCHRIGQKQPVTYIDIAVECGIDERIARALAKKANVVEQFRRQVEQAKNKPADLKRIIAEL